MGEPAGKADARPSLGPVEGPPGPAGAVGLVGDRALRGRFADTGDPAGAAGVGVPEASGGSATGLGLQRLQRFELPGSQLPGSQLPGGPRGSDMAARSLPRSIAPGAPFVGSPAQPSYAQRLPAAHSVAHAVLPSFGGAPGRPVVPIGPRPNAVGSELPRGSSGPRGLEGAEVVQRRPIQPGSPAEPGVAPLTSVGGQPQVGMASAGLVSTFAPAVLAVASPRMWRSATGGDDRSAAPGGSESLRTSSVQRVLPVHPGPVRPGGQPPLVLASTRAGVPARVPAPGSVSRLAGNRPGTEEGQGVQRLALQAARTVEGPSSGQSLPKWSFGSGLPALPSSKRSSARSFGSPLSPLLEHLESSAKTGASALMGSRGEQLLAEIAKLTRSVAPSTPPPSPPAQSEPSAQELRKLAARLFPYISQRLKSEIGRDRERAGMITGLHR